MALYPELHDLTLEELIAAFHGPPPDGDEYATSYYDEVARLIRQQGTAGIDFLFDASRHADAHRLAAIFLGLTTPALDDPKARQQLSALLRAHLHDDRDSVVIAAIEGLRYQDERDAADDVLALRDHRSPYVRACVRRYLSTIDRQGAAAAMVEDLSHPDPIVRLSAVDDLDDLGAVDALPRIRPLLKDKDPDVRALAEYAVQHLEQRARDQVQAHTSPALQRPGS